MRHDNEEQISRDDLAHAVKGGTKPVPTYIAVEFDLARGERTGKQMVFDAASLVEAAKKLAYTLNLSRAGWRVAPSGRTVGRMAGDIGWHLVKAGSPAARNMGASL